MEEKQRTIQQNKALWLYFRKLAEAFNEAGLDMKIVLKPEIAIEWNEKSVHDYLWIPVQEKMLGKVSTTELNTSEINKVWETLNRFISDKFGMFVNFPSEETLMEEANGN